MKIDEYIEIIKEKTKNYTDIEKLRYVYIDLGRIMSFDTEFVYGIENKKKLIYDNCTSDIKKINETFEKKIIICKSLSQILNYILNKIGIKTEINIEYYEDIPYKHVNNIVTIENEKYVIDLQQDLKNIQMHSTTEYFLMDIFDYQIFSKNQLKKIDKKIGYITDENPYIEEYIYTIKKSIDKNLKIEEKIEEIIHLIEKYINTNNIGYYEKRCIYYSIIKNILNEKEMRYVKFIDGYQMGNIKNYNLFIVINNIVYMCSEKFSLKTLDEITQMIKDGYVLLGDIPQLKNNRKVI